MGARSRINEEAALNVLPAVQQPFRDRICQRIDGRCFLDGLDGLPMIVQNLRMP